jgi:23S rRNA (cytosine1962-C5)-methyltransferase
VGLFLDQRDNRRRLLTRHVAAGFPLPDTTGGRSGPATLLNTFAYTCAFSACAARAGYHTTSLDLSKKYLEWGRRNFALNQLDPDGHDFIYGDVFDWMRRLAKKKRQFDIILLDPPTFSQSREGGVFRAEKDYGRLVRESMALLQKPGILFAATNAARLDPESFLARVSGGVQDARRSILQSHFAPQPPDFPVTRSEPAHLKTVWLQIT